MTQVNLKELFGALQTELQAKLSVGDSIIHAPTHGDDTELNWTKLLESLPSRYAVTKGFVVDANGQLSEQIDAIIYDRYYSPVVFRRESTVYVPAESVYAVLEVKQELTKADIEYAGAKAKSVRDLSRTSTPVRQIDGSLRRKEILPPILAGILTAKSSWSPALGQSFEDVLRGLDGNSTLDFGIALEDGSFNCTYGPEGSIAIEQSEPDVSLISFFINLNKQLQLFGNAPGIDLDAYYNTGE